MYKTSSATGSLRISSTEPPHSPRSYARIEEEFLALRNSRGKEPIDLAEGSGDSDDPTDEAEEPVVIGSRRRVRKRGSNNKSQLQELIDLYKESKVKKDKAKNSTPPESKKSKSVTSPEKPAQNSIGEAMVILNQMKGTISVREYLAGTARITEDERWRQAFVWMYDEARRECSSPSTEDDYGGKKKKEKGLGPLVGDPDPTIKVADTHRGRQKPRGWGWGRRLVALAPESTGISSSRSLFIRGRKPPICDPDPTSTVSGILYGCM
ncbi:hypothetical protein CRG98_025905 [Punica granatum]|uniref:Uncharacterized protein n=1 Tax=Punica granatum TaxID=22663 RepID=A0A2I0JBQ9_PUNGR|nr:hypothetical protein CRG98_025905 [Punica granatum]